MGVIKRQSIKGAIATYAGVLLGMLNVLFVFPYCLSATEIGLLGVMVDMVKLFTPLIMLGSGLMCVRYFPYFEDKEKGHNGMLFFIVGISAIGYLSFLVFFLLNQSWATQLFQKQSPLLVRYFLWLLPLALFWIYTQVFEYYCRSLKRIVVPAIIREVYVRIFALALVVVYYWGMINQMQLVSLYVLLFGSATLLLIAYVASMGQLFLKPDLDRFRVPAFRKEVAIYMGYTLLAGLGSVAVGRIDSMMIASVLDLESNGIYRIAFFIGVVIEIPRRVIGQIAAPVVSDKLKNNQLDEVAKLYKQVGINQLIFALLLLIGIWCNVDAIFKIMPNGHIYAAGKYVVLFIGLSKLFDMMTSINNEILLYSRYFRYNIPIIFCLLALTIATNLWLLPQYKITGAAIATAITIFIYNIIKFCLIWFKMGMQPFTRNTLIALGIGAITLAVNYYLLPVFDGVWIDLIIRSTVIGSLFCTLTLALRVSPDLNEMFWQILHRIRPSS